MSNNNNEEFKKTVEEIFGTDKTTEDLKKRLYETIKETIKETFGNHFDIQYYLVEPDFAKWMKEQGFDGECCAWCRPHYGIDVTTNATNKNMSESNCAVPTFAQTFDFIEEKFGIRITIIQAQGGTYYFLIWQWVQVFSISFTEEELIKVTGFETKRDANIAACNAIREYVDNLPK